MSGKSSKQNIGGAEFAKAQGGGWLDKTTKFAFAGLTPILKGARARDSCD